MNARNSAPASKTKFPFTLKVVGVTPNSREPWTVRLLAAWPTALIVTVCAATVTLSKPVGTAFASQVAGLFQLPSAIEIKVPTALEVKDILSILAGGWTPPVSFFQWKINLKVVPAREVGRKIVAVWTVPWRFPFPNQVAPAIPAGTFVAPEPGWVVEPLGTTVVGA